MNFGNSAERKQKAHNGCGQIPVRTSPYRMVNDVIVIIIIIIIIFVIIIIIIIIIFVIAYR